MYKNHFLSRISLSFLLPMMGFMFIGLICLYSIEYDDKTRFFSFLISKSSTASYRQFRWMGIALLGLIAILFLRSNLFSYIAYGGYAFALLLLIFTLFVGVDVRGSKSWLLIGSFQFQPAEICKLFTALALSKYLSNPNLKVHLTETKLIAALFVLLPMILIVLQGETGQALVYLAFLIPLYYAKLTYKILNLSVIGIVISLLAFFVPFMLLMLLVCCASGLLYWYMKRKLKMKMMRIVLIVLGFIAFSFLVSNYGVPFIINKGLKSYQVQRIFATLNMNGRTQEWMSPATQKISKQAKMHYNVRQSIIAIGSGKIMGKGFLHGTQTRFAFVPEQKTDFIFCAWAESFGLIGSLFFIGLALFLITRLQTEAKKQRSSFSEMYMISIASILIIHFAVNLSVTMGLFPVVGITLPWVSYGGSSMMSFCTMIAIAIRLDMDKKNVVK